MISLKSVETQMFNRQSYDKHTISVLEIIAAYIANLYYHHFYGEAHRLRVDKKVNSVTGGYTHAVKAYITSLKKPEYYRRSIIGIHNYYQNTTKFTSISMKDCVDDIVQQFVPDEYFASMDTRQKEVILHNVLVDSVNNFSNEILCGSLLLSIIDNHKDPSTATSIKQKMIDCLLFEREKVYRQFFSTLVDPKKQNLARDMKVSSQMKEELTKLIKMNEKLSIKADKYADALENAKSVILEKNKLIMQFKKALRETHGKLIVLQNRPPAADIVIPNSQQHVSKFSSPFFRQQHQVAADGPVVNDVEESHSIVEEKDSDSVVDDHPQMAHPETTVVDEPLNTVVEYVKPDNTQFFASGLID